MHPRRPAGRPAGRSIATTLASTLAAVLLLPATAADAFVLRGTAVSAEADLSVEALAEVDMAPVARLRMATAARTALAARLRVAVETDGPNADRPNTDRPDTDRPNTDELDDSAHPHRERQVHEVGDIGRVTLAVNDRGMWLVHVDRAEGWTSRARRSDAPRHRIPVVFANRALCQVVEWVAHFSEGEVRTELSRRPLPDCDQTRNETFVVDPAAKVTLAVGEEHLHVVEVATADGWVAYRPDREGNPSTDGPDRTTDARPDSDADSQHDDGPGSDRVAIGFFNRRTCHQILWKAVLTEDGVRTAREDSRRDGCDTFEMQRFEVGEIGVVTMAVGSHSIHVRDVKTADGWTSRHVDEDRRAFEAVHFFNREHCTKVAWTAQLVDGEVVTHVERSHLDGCDRPDDRPADRPADGPVTDDTDARRTDEEPTDGQRDESGRDASTDTHASDSV